MAFKYYLNNEEYTPINTGGFSFDIQLVKDAGAYHYTTELGGKIVFGGSAYDFILKHSDCQRVELRIEETCTEGTFKILDLYFTNRDCTWKPDLKQVEIQPRANTLYQCLLDNYDRKFNFLETPNVVSSFFDSTPNFEYVVRIPENTLYPEDLPNFGSYVEVFPGDTSPFFGFVVYVREIVTTYCQGGEPQPPAGEGWEILEDNCEGRNLVKWYRKPPVFVDPLLLIGNFGGSTCIAPCVPSPPPVTVDEEDWFLMDTLELAGTIFSFWVDYNIIKEGQFDLNNGRLFTDVVNYGLNKHCEELDLQSQFLFQDINPVTGNTPSTTKGIQMHAISDVKDPEADEAATRELTTLKEILEGYVSSKLNCFWYIDENTKRLIVEHYNDLNNTSTLDLTAIEGGKWLRNKNQYEYDNTDIPRAEEFPSLDSSIDFTGVNIDYDNPCATGNKAYNTDKFFSEVAVIIGEPDEFPSDGIVMITPDSLNPEDISAESGAITGDFLPNSPQGMANLHGKFWKYYRPFPNGELNFNNEEFNKNRPVKKLQTVQVPICCFRFFDPRANFIGNNFTDGQLQSATYSPATGFIELTIQYNE